MSNGSASREGSYSSTSATYQAPPISPREGDWILAQVDPASTDSSIFQIIETPIPHSTLSLRARRYLRPSEITTPADTTETIVYDSDEVVQSSLHGAAWRELTPASITGRCLVLHSDDRDKPDTPKSSPSLPVFFCKRYVTSSGNVQSRTKGGFEKLLAANTRTIAKVEKPEKPVPHITIPKELKQVKRESPAEFDTDRMSPATTLKRVRVNVPEVHVWLTCTFDLLEPPTGSWGLERPLWEMYRTHVALTTGSNGDSLSAADFNSAVADWAPSVRYFNGVACNLRPKPARSDINIARWLHSTYHRERSSYVKLADVVAEYGFAFPHTPNSAGAVAQHFFGFVQHMNSYFFSHGPNKTDGIVTGVSRRMYLSPLPSPRPDNKDDRAGPAGPSGGDERKPVPAPAVLARPEELKHLGLEQFVAHMKARDPARAAHYDQAATILDAALIGPDVLLQVGADKLEALGLKLGVVHRMVMVLEEGRE